MAPMPAQRFAKALQAMPEATLALAQYLDDRLNRDGQKLSVREAGSWPEK